MPEILSRNHKYLILLVLAISVLIVGLHVYLWKSACDCMFAHKQALGRQIPSSWWDRKNSSLQVVVPESVQYTVSRKYPYYYVLRLRSGYTIDRASLHESPEIIGYFYATADLPWWYICDFMKLKRHEVITLDQNYAVYSHSKEWLKRANLNF